MAIMICSIASVYNWLIGFFLSILCIASSAASSKNVSPICELGMFIIADLNCRLFNFLAIMLNRKQLRMAHPSAGNVLPWPRPHRGSLKVPLYNLFKTMVLVTRLCFVCV